MHYMSLVKPPVSKMLKSGMVILLSNEEVGEHVTEKREEILVVLEGLATIIHGGKTIHVPRGKTHFIPENVTHNVINKGKLPLRYIYVVSIFS